MLFTLNRIQYSVNITFVCTGKPINLCDSLYYNIYLIVVVWNPALNISEVCLYQPLNFTNKVTKVMSIRENLLHYSFFLAHCTHEYIFSFILFRDNINKMIPNSISKGTQHNAHFSLYYKWFQGCHKTFMSFF